MTVKEKTKEDIAILTVSGKLMGGNETKEVHKKVKNLISEGRKKVIIDLSRVRWLNSQGLGMLISCLTSLRNADGELKIAGATDRVNSLFMITKLITVFDSFKTIDEAVASF